MKTLKEYLKFTWTNDKIGIGAFVFSLIMSFLFKPVPVMAIGFFLIALGVLVYSIHHFNKST